MKLLVEELREGNELYSSFTLNLNRRSQLAAFYPYLFIKNVPNGDFYIGIRKTNGAFQYEEHFTSSDLQALLNTTDTNIRIFKPVIPLNPIFMEKGDYEIYLYSENYTFKRTSFIGWIRQHEDLNNELSFTPLNDAENPLAFRLKVYKEGIQ